MTLFTRNIEMKGGACRGQRKISEVDFLTFSLEEVSVCVRLLTIALHRPSGL